MVEMSRPQHFFLQKSCRNGLWHVRPKHACMGYAADSVVRLRLGMQQATTSVQRGRPVSSTNFEWRNRWVKYFIVPLRLYLDLQGPRFGV